MEADWEVEIGGGAPILEALWPGFVDLRNSAEHLCKIAEACAFPALGRMLLALNQAGSPVWTAKCDLWEPEADAALACYVDLLPQSGMVFAEWQHAEEVCRRWVRHLQDAPLPDCNVELLIRQAIAGAAEGFGITAYLSVACLHEAVEGQTVQARMEELMVVFAEAIAGNESIFCFSRDLGCPIHSAFFERNGWDTDEFPVTQFPKIL